MKNFIFSVPFLLISSCNAFASDFDKLPDFSTKNWNGFYLGANVGRGVDLNFLSSDEDIYSREHEIGSFGGLQVGYNYQLNHLLLGIESDFNLSNDINTSIFGTDASWFATIRGRFGYSFDRFLVYGTGGIAYSNKVYSASSNDIVTENHFGWVLGAGLEAAISEKWSIRGEYLQLGYNENKGLELNRFELSSDHNHQILRLGLNYQF